MRTTTRVQEATVGATTMYCGECGTEVSGKFCVCCGTPRHDVNLPGRPQSNLGPQPNSGQQSINGVPQSTSLQAAAINWEEEVHYDTLLRVDEVRDAILDHSRRARKIVSAEEIFAIYDKVISSPIPLAKLSGVIQPMYESLGVRTGKSQTRILKAPVGQVIVRALCSLALNSQTLLRVDQGSTGCVLNAELPSSIFALKGEVCIAIERHPHGTQIAATTNIPGQWFDWGKSQRCIERFFEEIRHDVGIPVHRLSKSEAGMSSGRIDEHGSHARKHILHHPAERKVS